MNRPSPSAVSLPPPTPGPNALSSWRLLGVWLSLGVQSFGGGGATLTLIRRAVVERHGWATEGEFDRDWAICQICPGINLLALTILIGRRIAGLRGVVVCLLGLLFPTVVITVLLTASYARIRDLAWVRAALQAIIPASVGLGLLTAYNITAAQLKNSHSDAGQKFFVFDLLLVAASGTALLLIKPPVVLILLVAASASALFRVFGKSGPRPLTSPDKIDETDEATLS